MDTSKLKSAILNQTDPDKLRRIALDLLVAAKSVREEPSNYSVISRDGNTLSEGTKDFCIGWASAMEGTTLYSGDFHSGLRVMCGTFQVWPDWGGE